MAVHLPNENILLNRACHGNADAFGTLTSHYYANLYRITLKITHNREDAEDALQDALLKAYSRLDQFRYNSRFYTWLVRIAVNEAPMKLRKKRSGKEVSLDEITPVKLNRLKPITLRNYRWGNPEADCAYLETQVIVGRAVENLGPRLSTVFVLRNVEGLSARELADTLGLSVPAVKSRLLRARIKLRKRVTRAFRQPSGFRTPRIRSAQHPPSFAPRIERHTLVSAPGPSAARSEPKHRGTA